MSKVSRSIVALALAVLMLVPMGALAGAVAPTGNVLTIQLPLRPNLDIHWNAGNTGALLQTQIYEGLYNYTETGYELRGATSVDVSEDGLTWTFKLRPEAVWTDGKPVTAQDYVNSFRRLVDPAVGTIYAKDYGQFIKNGLAVVDGKVPVDQLGVKAIDDFTLEIQLENVCPFFDALLCYTAFYPLRTDTIKEAGLGYWAWDVNSLITNGPLKMTYCDEEQEMIFEKNPTYWDAANVKLDGLVVKLVDDTNTARRR